MERNRQRMMGAGGYCVCLKCGRREPHQPGLPCREMRCPDCSVPLVREGSEHHEKAMIKQNIRKEKQQGS
ncbi:MAG: ferredoxin [Acidobacteriota bacterium]|jgi:hypothetical protein